MKGAVLHGPRDIRYAEREESKIVAPTDVILRMSADLWPYRGIDASGQPPPMGHECRGIAEEVGGAVIARPDVVQRITAARIELLPKSAQEMATIMSADVTRFRA
jgi:threonine dehydrogenase-like Zn-dependent dehydrogenase